MIEHEFGRRIARRINLHLEEFMRGVDAREPLARYLRTYSVFILDHTSKEDRFFNIVKEAKSLTNGEEKSLRDQFERMRHDCIAKSGNMVDTLAELEKADWFA